MYILWAIVCSAFKEEKTLEVELIQSIGFYLNWNSCLAAFWRFKMCFQVEKRGLMVKGSGHYW